MTTAKAFRAPGVTINVALEASRLVILELVSLKFSLLVAICYLLVCATDARAQLWETPPLPPVKYAAAADGMTFSVGAEQVHISVCRATVVHFVANPARPKEIQQDQP